MTLGLQSRHPQFFNRVYANPIGQLARRARKFANRLHGRLRLPVEMVDERLSSFEAKQAAREQGHRGDYRSRPVDSLAAEIILQSWLAAREN